jgi:hypothetical protein
MKNSAISLFLVLVVGAFVLPGSPASAKSYDNCDDLLRDYPKGVARDAKAARKAVASGHQRPRVNKSVYETHQGGLDRDKDGVACEQT